MHAETPPWQDVVDRGRFGPLSDSLLERHFLRDLPLVAELSSIPIVPLCVIPLRVDCGIFSSEEMIADSILSWKHAGIH